MVFRCKSHMASQSSIKSIRFWTTFVQNTFCFISAVFSCCVKGLCPVAQSARRDPTDHHGARELYENKDMTLQNPTLQPGLRKQSDKLVVEYIHAQLAYISITAFTS